MTAVYIQGQCRVINLLSIVIIIMDVRHPYLCACNVHSSSQFYRGYASKKISAGLHCDLKC